MRNSFGGEFADGCNRELLSDHGRCLEHPALLGRQSIETSGEQRLDRRWHLDGGDVTRSTPPISFADETTLIDQHRDHLLDEQRVALDRLDNPLGHVDRQGAGPEEVCYQQLGLLIRKWFERDSGGVHLAAPPARTSVQEVGPSHAEQQDRRSPRPVRDVLDEVQEHRLAPVNVIEHDR